jgi:hypothetical protein
MGVSFGADVNCSTDGGKRGPRQYPRLAFAVITKANLWFCEGSGLAQHMAPRPENKTHPDQAAKGFPDIAYATPPPTDVYEKLF